MPLRKDLESRLKQSQSQNSSNKPNSGTHGSEKRQLCTNAKIRCYAIISYHSVAISQSKQNNKTTRCPNEKSSFAMQCVIYMCGHCMWMWGTRDCIPACWNVLSLPAPCRWGMVTPLASPCKGTYWSHCSVKLARANASFNDRGADGSSAFAP